MSSRTFKKFFLFLTSQIYDTQGSSSVYFSLKVKIQLLHFWGTEEMYAADTKKVPRVTNGNTVNTKV